MEGYATPFDAETTSDYGCTMAGDRHPGRRHLGDQVALVAISAPVYWLGVAAPAAYRRRLNDGR